MNRNLNRALYMATAVLIFGIAVAFYASRAFAFAQHERQAAERALLP